MLVSLSALCLLQWVESKGAPGESRAQPPGPAWALPATTVPPGLSAWAIPTAPTPSPGLSQYYTPSTSTSMDKSRDFLSVPYTSQFGTGPSGSWGRAQPYHPAPSSTPCVTCSSLLHGRSRTLDKTGYRDSGFLTSRGSPGLAYSPRFTPANQGQESYQGRYGGYNLPQNIPPAFGGNKGQRVGNVQHSGLQQGFKQSFQQGNFQQGGSQQGFQQVYHQGGFKQGGSQQVYHQGGFQQGGSQQGFQQGGFQQKGLYAGRVGSSPQQQQVVKDGRIYENYKRDPTKKTGVYVIPSPTKLYVDGVKN